MCKQSLGLRHSNLNKFFLQFDRTSSSCYLGIHKLCRIQIRRPGTHEKAATAAAVVAAAALLLELLLMLVGLLWGLL